MEGALKPHRNFRVEWATHCPGCGRAVRPRNVSRAEWPGTVQAQASTGECGVCYFGGAVGVPVAHGKKLPVKDRERIRFENTVAGLESLLRRRRARGVPEEGWAVEDES